MLIHQGSVGLPRSAMPDVEVFARETLRVTNTMIEVMARHSGQPFDKVKRDTNRDYYMTPGEAKDYGIIDHIVLPTKTGFDRLARESQ